MEVSCSGHRELILCNAGNGSERPVQPKANVKSPVPHSTADSAIIAQRGKRLEYLTISWNSLEGLAALTTGMIAGSVSLVGFGVDSFIEVTSAVALLWRLSIVADEASREHSERVTLKIVGVCFLGLSACIAYASISGLLRKQAPEHSIAGIVVACAALVAMPLLSRAKKQIGEQLGSGAMIADARQADFCAYLSGILLVGLILNATLGWWWADPIAALAMVPIIAKEGIDALQGKACCEAACRSPK
jgi:divalent metal cation (Fe/Co/Zn/Cd) transporter